MTNYCFTKFSSEKWECRYSALLAMGAIMEGPSQEYIH